MSSWPHAPHVEMPATWTRNSGWAMPNATDCVSEPEASAEAIFERGGGEQE
jgi:hypothetical protein